jgi:MFS family permease
VVAVGYPAGAVVGGLVVAQFLKTHDWRSVFYFGAAVSAAFIPLIFFLVPESVEWLARKQLPNALPKINRALERLGHATLTVLPQMTLTAARRTSIAELFTPGLVLVTLSVTASYALHITTFYFILKWVPKIVVDMHFPQSAAAGVLV